MSLTVKINASDETGRTYSWDKMLQAPPGTIFKPENLDWSRLFLCIKNGIVAFDADSNGSLPYIPPPDVWTDKRFLKLPNAKCTITFDDC